MKKDKSVYIIYLSLSLVLLSYFIISPKTAIFYAKNGIILCGNVIIPSLFPVNFCVIFIMKLIGNFNFKSDSIKNNLLFLFSLIGGYPTGAKLINEEYKQGNISRHNARIMQYYSANGGIGFIISAVGYGIYGSKKLGYLLFLSHSVSSLILGILLKRFLKKEKSAKDTAKAENIADIFVLSASEASNAILSICSFVIFFSVINGFLSKTKYLKYLCYVTEITSALNLTKNIYFTAFLLGFCGISIWCQIIAVSKDVGIDFIKFFFSRLFCGGLSAILIYIFLKIFRESTDVFSNNVSFVGEAVKERLSVSVALGIMAVLLIISLEGKKRGGNLRYDLLK